MDDDAIAMDAAPSSNARTRGTAADSSTTRSPLTNKTRSLSDGGGTPSKLRLSPSPHIVEASRRTSKDDSTIPDVPTPVTPRRPGLGFAPLAPVPTQDLPLPRREFTPPAAANPNSKPAPLSPKLDHSQIYASPTNILPRRSRGLDFSRAATSLHHSTLAEQSSPDSSPTAAGRAAMNIPSRRSHYSQSNAGLGPEQTSSSLWSVMGNHDKNHIISSSLGSTAAVVSDSSSSSDNDDLMDDDMDESYVTTPQISRTGPPMGLGGQGLFGSPAMSSLMSFQQRQRPRKTQKKKRGHLGFGLNSATAASLSKSPPSTAARTRRESISWQANQLHISSTDAEDMPRGMGDGDGDGQRSVIRRVVTRRANLLPKTKTFARIRAALLEEGAPADAEWRREAEVVKQVRESDVDLEPRIPASIADSTQNTTAPSSPNMTQQDSLEEVQDDDEMGDLAMGLSSSFKQHAIKNSKGKTFWDTFSESGSNGGTRTTPPPGASQPRGSSSGISEDVSMDSPSLAGPPGFPPGYGSQPPSAAEITRRINSKRRREDDFDPLSFKRRAVSPGMSVQGSPITQSPLQRDMGPWGSRPGSNGGDKAGSGAGGGSSAPSESGSTPGNVSGGSGAAAGRVNGKGRIGFQGMIDTNDGIMRMSIE